MRGRRTWPPETLRTIEDLHYEGRSPREIHQGLEENPQIKPADIPGVRTIERHVDRLPPKDGSGPWRIEHDREPQVLLDVLASVIKATQGRIRDFTEAEAGFVRAIRAGSPDLDPWTVYLTARRYIGAGDSGRAALDAFLALRPWRNDEAAQRYEELLQLGWVDKPTPVQLPSAVMVADIRERLRKAGEEAQGK